MHIKDQLKTKQAAAKEAEKENRTNMEQYTKLEQGIVAIKVSNVS